MAYFIGVVPQVVICFLFCFCFCFLVLFFFFDFFFCFSFFSVIGFGLLNIHLLLN